MTAAPKAIGLLGGTFDPVHNGHVSIVHSYLASGLLSKLILTLTPDPPHKKSRELTGYNHRMQMLNIVFQGVENLSISSVEQQLPKPSYTLNTVEYFRSLYRETELYLCIGEDSLNNFKDWYQWESIISKCILLVAKRPNSEKQPLPEKLRNHVRFIEHKEVAVSSSQIRKKIEQDEEVDDMLPSEVLDYIKAHKLYRN